MGLFGVQNNPYENYGQYGKVPFGSLTTKVGTSPVSGTQEVFSFANINLDKPNDVGGNSSITGLNGVHGAVFDTRQLGFDY